jgi:hypothetical protein
MFGIGAGPSGAEKADAGLLGNAATFGTGQGESDILKAQNFWSSILSGDMSKISQVLGPEMSAVNKQGQEKKKTMAEFGNRSGGTNAVAANLDTDVMSQIRSMISNLTGSSASSLGSTGSNLLNTGVGAGTAKFGADAAIHDQNAAKWNDIFKSIGGIAGGVASFFPGGSLMSKGLTGVEGVMGG